ncbi:hypothetical protein TGDOM2_270360 [Toxoplasma gondii GAB2-2007-GAL-DOM2]|nr:hypothetical protein TGGT1_270360 [Toxoplasma gondii GT1]KAF4642286.1 hypothetical protein TGRH88_081010 [Toxoplasma gondii]KFG43706.1 hypothetical protein TGDOM2_270360 [Toxoplasma gondii GAB2-2007-GAL-DOM2]KFG54390.1 hypothetical protein TGFOU_270360 [Toxoplasma gondii FOU]RQX75259.1 hypothetical protein TGCAST_270360 [Toxoplasma gondii CAST]
MQNGVFTRENADFLVKSGADSPSSQSLLLRTSPSPLSLPRRRFIFLRSASFDLSERSSLACLAPFFCLASGVSLRSAFSLPFFARRGRPCLFFIFIFFFRVSFTANFRGERVKMAASTIPISQWPSLLYAPPSSPANPAVEALPEMQFDDLHYPRQMLLCRGAGYSLEQCNRMAQPDARVTPENPAEKLLKEEAVAAIACLSQREGGKDEQCRYYIERMYKLANKEKQPEPGMLSKASTLACKLLGIHRPEA